MDGVLAGRGLGFVQVVDNPTRQTFIHEMVGPDDLADAVSLNAVVVNVARVIGPGFAGALIVTIGLAPCFFINGLSYGAVLVALALMNPARLLRAPSPDGVRASSGRVSAT